MKLKFLAGALGLLCYSVVILFCGVGIGMIDGIVRMEGRPMDLTSMPSITNFKERDFIVNRADCARGEALISRKTKPNEWIYVKLPKDLACVPQARLVTVRSNTDIRMQ